MTKRSVISLSIALLFGLTVAGYPLISAIPVLFGLDSRAVSIPYRAFVALLSLGVIVSVAIRRRKAYSGLFWFPFAVFWALYLLRLVLDTVFLPSPLRLSAAEYFMYSIGMVFIPTVALLIRQDDKTLELGLRVTTAMTAVACAAAVLLGAKSVASGDLSFLVTGRLATDTLNSISLGHLGASLFILSTFLLLRKRSPSHVPNAVLMGLIGLGLLAVGASASRGPILVLLTVFPVLLWSAYRNGARIRAPFVGLLVIGGALAAMQSLQENLGFSVVSRLALAANYAEDPSSQGRVELIRGAWGAYLDHPVLGSGLEEPASGFYPHNVVVESFMATGIFGGLAFAALVVLSLAATWRLMKNDPANGWIALLYLQYLVGAQFSGSLSGSPEMWCLMAAVVSTSRRGHAKTVPKRSLFEPNSIPATHIQQAPAT